MARSVIIGIAAAGMSLALTAILVTPSMAMTSNDYSVSYANTSPVSGTQEAVDGLFSGRLQAKQRRDARNDEALTLIRSGTKTPQMAVEESAPPAALRPFSLTLPFVIR